MSEIVQKQFSAGAKHYNRQRRQLIPCFDDFYGTAAEWVTCERQTPRILDLGAGTGLFSAFIRSKYPDAELTLIDFSGEMLEQARIRFAGDPNVQYIAADYTSYAFTERYDAVISSLSIHHLTHQAKRDLFGTIRGLLAEGGCFVNADQAAGATPAIDKTYMSRWKAAVRASGLPEEALAASIERRKSDINATVPEQLQWLNEAGFAEADCVYKYDGFAVFFAK
ncbi:class I SAM-dependent methyltransferase [Paenibacillus sp. N4]|uniref:class I SAM-dependent methyltransferase n=1 Tax=Paenibacillus vietnamensis TaxID=2590547 RepID=UPI001CD0C393|nr:class I SAM-dependent methyltransferase [Paenibacillus vietnamensis]MCA0756823.1 class I SAM-dependent methyltransferase [Paenibacillus vietnamensis]